MAKFGYSPNHEETDWILGDPEAPGVYGMGPTDSGRMQQEWSDSRPVLLTDALIALQPNWRRGAQGIGDCVAWGYEVACTIATAVDIYIDKEPWRWPGPYATEPIYGGSRVEARGKSRGSWSDGSYGGAAAKWITKWGVLKRVNYSVTTGVSDHNLSTYNKDKAKQWGYWGSGGKYDKGRLDKVAKDYPAKEAVLVTSFKDAANCILSGYPIAVCSGQGFTKTRDEDGFCKPRGNWSHCMAFVGARFDRPGLLCMNSWGYSNKGPHGISTHDEVMKASFWVDDSVVDRMLRGQDSFAITGVKGLEKRSIDFTTGWEI